jgi:2-keto-4-pentenoate hydratase/2-oxohepta-3-ene-1,7-dioic acid hydratase in catechol pathway
LKLLRFGPKGQEKPAILDDNGVIRDLSTHIPDLSGHALSPKSLHEIKKIDLSTLPAVDENTRIGACVGDAGKFICVGLNYHDHIKETGAETPKEPVLFAKLCDVSGPNDDVIIPKNSEKTDWEVELGVIIGERTRHVSEEKALEHIAGYCVINDISERHFQTERGGQWMKGKSCDTFAPIGPYLVTTDEVTNPQNLHLWLDVDGQRYQDSNTSEMVFGIAEIVSYISRFLTLNAGDIISTGTPPGVGLGVKPNPIFLKEGQHMKLGIDGLGEQQQIAIAEA